MKDKTLVSVLKECANRGITVTITTKNATIAEISVTNGEQTANDLVTMSNRKLPEAIHNLARTFSSSKLPLAKPQKADNRTIEEAFDAN